MCLANKAQYFVQLEQCTKKKYTYTVLHTSTLKQLKNNFLSTAKSSKIRTK